MEVQPQPLWRSVRRRLETFRYKGNLVFSDKAIRLLLGAHPELRSKPYLDGFSADDVTMMLWAKFVDMADGHHLVGSDAHGNRWLVFTADQCNHTSHYRDGRFLVKVKTTNVEGVKQDQKKPFVWFASAVLFDSVDTPTTLPPVGTHDPLKPQLVMADGRRCVGHQASAMHGLDAQQKPLICCNPYHYGPENVWKRWSRKQRNEHVRLVREAHQQRTARLQGLSSPMPVPGPRSLPHNHPPHRHSTASNASSLDSTWDSLFAFDDLDCPAVTAPGFDGFAVIGGAGGSGFATGGGAGGHGFPGVGGAGHGFATVGGAGVNLLPEVSPTYSSPPTAPMMASGSAASLSLPSSAGASSSAAFAAMPPPPPNPPAQGFDKFVELANLQSRYLALTRSISPEEWKAHRGKIGPGWQKLKEQGDYMFQQLQAHSAEGHSSAAGNGGFVDLDAPMAPFQRGTRADPGHSAVTLKQVRPNRRVARGEECLLILEVGPSDAITNETYLRVGGKDFNVSRAEGKQECRVQFLATEVLGTHKMEAQLLKVGPLGEEPTVLATQKIAVTVLPAVLELVEAPKGTDKYADNTVVAPGKEITKTWIVRNASCAPVPDDVVVCDRRRRQVPQSTFTRLDEDGGVERFEVTVTCTMPSQPGRLSRTWYLVSNDEHLSDRLWVDLTVQDCVEAASDEQASALNCGPSYASSPAAQEVSCGA